MTRTIVRWVLAVLGVLAMLAGIAIAGGSMWVRSVLDPQGALTSATSSISAAQCETLLIEIAETGLRADELEGLPVVSDRARRSLAVQVPGRDDDDPMVLIGIGDSAAVEQRLLGARYCLATFGPDGWSTRNITLSADAPDIDLDGLTGVWGRAAAGESVIVPLPESGSTLVVSVDGPGDLGSVELTGRYRIEGAPDLLLSGIITGSVVIGVGLVLLLIGTVALRRRGKHEGAPAAAASPTPADASPSGQPTNQPNDQPPS